MISPYLKSILVFVGLAVFTGIEYIIGTMDADDLPIFSSNITPLAVIAVIKAGLIAYYYMHIYRLWATEEEEAH